MESLKHVNQKAGRSWAWLRWAFFDVEKRYAALDAKNDPLVKINAVVPWEAFRSRLEKVWRKPADKRKSNAGCKPWDAIVMFKAIVLCALYNLSDDQVEYQMRDRLSFMRFLGLALEDKVPDAKTVWLYREQLSQAGVIEALFDDFDGYLKTQGYQATGGQIIDASIVAVPKQRNSRADNARIKQGETPKEWADKAARRRQKDTDARWTKKARQESLWLQEPPQHRPQAQADSSLQRDGRVGSRQPGGDRVYGCGEGVTFHIARPDNNARKAVAGWVGSGGEALCGGIRSVEVGEVGCVEVAHEGEGRVEGVIRDIHGGLGGVGGCRHGQRAKQAEDNGNENGMANRSAELPPGGSDSRFHEHGFPCSNRAKTLGSGTADCGSKASTARAP